MSAVSLQEAGSDTVGLDLDMNLLDLVVSVGALTCDVWHTNP